MLMSIRLRLTLLYSAILALTLLGLAIVLMVSVSQINLRTQEDNLREDAKRLIYTREFDLDHPGYDGRRIAMPDTYLQTRTTDGQIVARSTNLDDFELPIDSARLAAADDGQG